jgi:hypothetical protein
LYEKSLNYYKNHMAKKVPQQGYEWGSVRPSRRGRNSCRGLQRGPYGAVAQHVPLAHSLGAGGDARQPASVGERILVLLLLLLLLLLDIVDYSKTPLT